MPTSRPATSIRHLPVACCVLFLELNRLGTAVLIATHDIGLMDQLDARRMVIEGGHLEIYE